MVYFSMAEWDFLEEQRDLYKDVMMDNQQLLSYVNLGKNNLLLSEMILNLTLSQPPLTSPDGSSKRNPPERCPRPLDSRDSTLEDHNYAHRFQGKDLIDLKVEVNVEQTYVGGDQSMEQVEMLAPLKEVESFQVTMEDRPLITSPDGSSKRNAPERCPRPLYSRDPTQEDLTVPRHETCPRPLYSRDSTQEDHNYAQPYQCEDRGNMKADNKNGEEEEIIVLRGGQPSTEEAGMMVTEPEEKSSPDITKDGSSNGESAERCPRPLDSTLEDHNYAQHYQNCEDLMSMKADNKGEEEEEVNVRGDHQSTEETGVLMTENKEESSRDITKDGSGSRNTPKKCPSPLYSRDSTQEDLTIPHHDQDKELKIKVKKEEEEMYVTGDQRASEVERMDTDKEEEPSPDISSDGHSVRNSSEGDPMLPPDYKPEDDDITQHSPGMNPIPHNRHHRPSRLETSMDPSNPEEPSEPSQTRTSDDPLISPRVDRSKYPSHLLESSLGRKGDLPGGNLWSCLECGKRFTKNRALLKHQRIHKGERPFSCTECGKSFTVKGELLRHQRIHTGEEHFSCSDFRRCFSQKEKLNINQKILTDDRSSSCLECGKCLIQKEDLVEHHRIHTGKHAFTFSECEKGFIEKRTLLIHHTGHTDGHPHSCLDCGKSFTRNNTLIRHQRSHTGEHPFSCLECGKCFVQKEHLQRHQKIHTYGKGFSVKGSLLIHKTIHTGERPFPCSECGKCFAAKGKLLIHQRLHRGQHPYSCSECGKCFSVKRGLLIHQRVHMGEQPYLCSAGGKCFTEKGSLLKSQRRHTRKGPFSCSECGKSFKHKENLIRHQSTHSC